MPNPMRMSWNPIAPALVTLVWACTASVSHADLTQRAAECHYSTPDGVHIFAEVEVDEPPLLVDHPYPMPYPSEMFRLGIAGTVSLHYVIDSTGTVVASSIYVDSASQPEFVPAAHELLTTSRFRPAIRNHQRVAVCVKQDLNWVLN